MKGYDDDDDTDWDDVMFCAVKAVSNSDYADAKEYAGYLTQNVERVKIEYGPNA